MNPVRLWDHQVQEAYEQLTTRPKDVWVVDLVFGGMQIQFKKPRPIVTQVYVGRFCRRQDQNMDISEAAFAREVHFAGDVLQGRKAA